MTNHILFVCLGNICRSPAAEAVFCNLARDAGLVVETDSAGTSDWHIGDAPYQPMQSAAAAKGYNLSALRARQFTSDDFKNFDLIIGMDNNNLERMEHLRPQGDTTPVHLFLEYATETGVHEVPDPYYTHDFNQALELIEAASYGLIDQLLEQVSSAAAPKAL